MQKPIGDLQSVIKKMEQTVSSLYRRILRLRRRIPDADIRKRWVFNAREIIFLYSRPQYTSEYRRLHPYQGEKPSQSEQAATVSQFVKRKVSEAHQDLDLIEELMDEAKGPFESLFFQSFRERLL